jgi:glycosyltransferase involved in cell wall biosynthesis
VHTSTDELLACMQELLHDPAGAMRLSEGARRTAQERFNIERFSRDWHETFMQMCGYW